MRAQAPRRCPRPSLAVALSRRRMDVAACDHGAFSVLPGIHFARLAQGARVANLRTVALR